MKRIFVFGLLLVTGLRFDNPKDYMYFQIIEAVQDDTSYVLSSNQFISYKGYLIEFITKDLINEERFIISGKRNYEIRTELEKVNFIDIAKKTYFSIDTFSKECKIIEDGLLSKHILGVNYTDSLEKNEVPEYKLSSCRDTLFKGIDYLYYPYSIKDKKGQDSIFCKALFIKDTNMLSIMSVNSKAFVEKYPMVGFIAHTKYLKQGLWIYVKDKKQVTKDEINIMEAILEKHRKKVSV